MKDTKYIKGDKIYLKNVNDAVTVELDTTAGDKIVRTSKGIFDIENIEHRKGNNNIRINTGTNPTGIRPYTNKIK